ncbi:hypothetical protein ACTJJ0_03315 [Chitinophaga sp. 22321]|uniref:Outer membrane protein beta-barrel family protein n=1 Tax=Chitinophaga hostae TaxID=2831022 RepID=A0ABS5IXK2_9BACT|nr:hypothetical protein [Chitinophaga hostae]MBS0027671.1 hypothetical protein [Chitinophaga hostae]
MKSIFTCCLLLVLAQVTVYAAMLSDRTPPPPHRDTSQKPLAEPGNIVYSKLTSIPEAIRTVRFNLLEIPKGSYDQVVQQSKVHDQKTSITFAQYQQLLDSVTRKKQKDSSSITISLEIAQDKGKLMPPLTLVIFNTAKKSADSIKLIMPDGSVVPAAPGETTPAGHDAGVADKAATTLNKRENVLTDLKALDINTLTAPKIFINDNMFLSSGNWGFSEKEECVPNKKKRRLPGEYILLYDMKKGDYYTLKKKIRKWEEGDPGDAKDCPYVEYYKWKRSILFTPSIGSQFKVQLMNINAEDNWHISASYKDNFLEDEAAFRSTFQAFNTRANSTGAATGTGEKTNEVALESKKEDKTAANLLALRNDLLYYSKRFYVNLATAEKHAENMKEIDQKIVQTFGTNLSSLLSAYLIEMDTDDPLNTLMKKIRDAYNNVNGLESQSFTAFKLKNMDYLELTFKDDAGNTKKEEEIRLSGGLKIDFSTGIALTGLKDFTYILKDTVVSYRTDTATGTLPRDTTGKIIRRENDGKSSVNFGIYMHVYPRLSSNYNVSLTVGISTNTNLDINFVTGGSLLFGSRRRLVLTGGVIWGKVERLSNSVEEGYHESPGANGALRPAFIPQGTSVVPVVKQWKHSWFFGVSWNFTN